MFTIGLDVDTKVVSGIIVILFFTIKLYAGKFKKLLGPLNIRLLGKIQIEEQPASNSELNNKISDHIQKHKKPKTDEEFGYYLAGLIEGDGYFGENRLEIIFHLEDASLAYMIKKYIGYGSIYKIKNKKVLKYSLRHSKGISNILSIVNGKFITDNKINQLKKNNYEEKYKIKILPATNIDLMTNHWLAGYTDADGCFKITIKNSSTNKLKKCVQLEFEIKEKKEKILKEIKEKFSGNIYYNSKKEIYNYRSTSKITNNQLINYFDKFNLNSKKYIEYFKWRKVYRMILRKEHLTLCGLKKIYKIKRNFRDYTLNSLLKKEINE